MMDYWTFRDALANDIRAGRPMSVEEFAAALRESFRHHNTSMRELVRHVREQCGLPPDDAVAWVRRFIHNARQNRG